jgi:hypothetical protein
MAAGGGCLNVRSWKRHDDAVLPAGSRHHRRARREFIWCCPVRHMILRPGCAGPGGAGRIGKTECCSSCTPFTRSCGTGAGTGASRGSGRCDWPDTTKLIIDEPLSLKTTRDPFARSSPGGRPGVLVSRDPGTCRAIRAALRVVPKPTRHAAVAACGQLGPWTHGASTRYRVRSQDEVSSGRAGSARLFCPGLVLYAMPAPAGRQGRNGQFRTKSSLPRSFSPGTRGPEQGGFAVCRDAGIR